MRFASVCCTAPLQHMIMSTFISNSPPKAEKERIAQKRHVAKQIAYALVGFDCTTCRQEILPWEYRFAEIVKSVDRGNPKCLGCHEKEYTLCGECSAQILIEPGERHLCGACRDFFNEEPIPGPDEVDVS